MPLVHPIHQNVRPVHLSWLQMSWAMIGRRPMLVCHYEKNVDYRVSVMTFAQQQQRWRRHYFASLPSPLVQTPQRISSRCGCFSNSHRRRRCRFQRMLLRLWYMLRTFGSVLSPLKSPATKTTRKPMMMVTCLQTKSTTSRSKTMLWRLIRKLFWHEKQKPDSVRITPLFANRKKRIGGC